MQHIDVIAESCKAVTGRQMFLWPSALLSSRSDIQMKADHCHRLACFYLRRSQNGCTLEAGQKGGALKNFISLRNILTCYIEFLRHKEYIYEELQRNMNFAFC